MRRGEAESNGRRVVVRNAKTVRHVVTLRLRIEQRPGQRKLERRHKRRDRREKELLLKLNKVFLKPPVRIDMANNVDIIRPRPIRETLLRVDQRSEEHTSELQSRGHL